MEPAWARRSGPLDIWGDIPGTEDLLGMVSDIAIRFHGDCPKLKKICGILTARSKKKMGKEAVCAASRRMAAPDEES